MNIVKYTFVSNSREETRDLGKLLAPFFVSGDVVLLNGDLGAGKTTLVSGVAEALHSGEDVISPTFTILKCYFKGSLPLYHIDAYRLENQNIELGLDEYIEGNGVTMVEWPQYIAPLLPENTLSITLENLGDDQRRLTLEGKTPHYIAMVTAAKGEFQ